MNEHLIEAVRKLVGSKFSIAGETITYDEEVTPPTRLEIEDMIEQVKKQQLQAELQSEARQMAIEDIVKEKVEKDYKTSMDIVKAKIEAGEITKDAGKELKDELTKAK